MSSTRMTRGLPAIVLAVSLVGCEEKPKDAGGGAKASAAPKATVSAPPPPPPAPKPEVKKPSHECPKGSEGEGTFSKPCKATGTARAMEVKWNGKISDKGPTFRVINKTDLEILYGSIVVYFYDKAGKQIEVESGGKKLKRVTCSGNIFAGPMKAGEKAFLNFSCVKKDIVPEDAAAIEAELQTVGFTEKDGNKPDTYWRNKDLVPAERPKGGIKKK